MQAQRQRRSNLEVMADILRLGEAGKTEIMYRASMSYQQLQIYLGNMVDQGLLERFELPNRGGKFRPTPKGRELLKRIDDALRVLKVQA